MKRHKIHVFNARANIRRRYKDIPFSFLMMCHGTNLSVSIFDAEPSITVTLYIHWLLPHFGHIHTDVAHQATHIGGLYFLHLDGAAAPRFVFPALRSLSLSVLSMHLEKE